MLATGWALMSLVILAWPAGELLNEDFVVPGLHFAVSFAVLLLCQGEQRSVHRTSVSCNDPAEPSLSLRNPLRSCRRINDH